MPEEHEGGIGGPGPGRELGRQAQQRLLDAGEIGVEDRRERWIVRLVRGRDPRIVQIEEPARLVPGLEALEEGAESGVIEIRDDQRLDGWRQHADLSLLQPVAERPHQRRIAEPDDLRQPLGAGGVPVVLRGRARDTAVEQLLLAFRQWRSLTGEREHHAGGADEAAEPAEATRATCAWHRPDAPVLYGAEGPGGETGAGAAGAMENPPTAGARFNGTAREG